MIIYTANDSMFSNAFNCRNAYITNNDTLAVIDDFLLRLSIHYFHITNRTFCQYQIYPYRQLPCRRNQEESTLYKCSWKHAVSCIGHRLAIRFLLFIKKAVFPLLNCLCCSYKKYMGLFSGFLFVFIFDLRDLNSPTRDGTQVPAVKVLSSNHWTDREFPMGLFLDSQLYSVDLDVSPRHI